MAGIESSTPKRREQVDLPTQRVDAPEEASRKFATPVPINVGKQGVETAPSSLTGNRFVEVAKSIGGQMVERVGTVLNNAADRFIASNSIRGLGGQINNLKRQYESDEQAAQAASGRGERSQVIALRTKQMETLASLDERAKERSAHADGLRKHYEGKLTAPLQHRAKWGEARKEAVTRHEELKGVNAERLALFQEVNERLTALFEAGHSQKSEEVQQVFDKLKELDLQMKEGEQTMADLNKEIGENTAKIELWDKKNRKVVAKIDRWKDIAMSGTYGTSAEGLSRQKAIQEAGNVSPLPATGEPKAPAAAESTSVKTAGGAQSAPLETATESLSEQELISALAELLNRPEKFDFDTEMKKLADSELGKFAQMSRHKDNLIDSWNRLAKADKQFEAINDRQRVRLSTNAQGEVSILNFGKQLKEQFKKKPEMVIKGITMMARALKERPSSQAA